ncbi:hypothetical protein PYW08_013032 [Mythimna loreyi]|uniref:Uncharacterized protein n=1 Tax=Mythimna loreyi TaxID=667449 RepID=A0ACC2PZP7_9NEOP|nr:hypothetical protein PYW08_013032 [Mythimna loreyi]
MAGVQRTPPNTPRTQFSNIGVAETRSEPDISTAVSECGYVNTNRSKRPRSQVSPREESDHESPLKLELQLAKWKKEQDSSIAKQLADQTSLIAKLSSDIGDIKKQNNLIQASNAEIFKSNSGIIQSLEFFNKQFEDLKAEVETLRKERRDQQIYIENLEQKIIDLQHKSRSSGVELLRLYNKGRGKDDKLNTSVMGMPGDRRPVYIAEHLPPSTKKLFYLAREFANKNAYKFCWISNGNIFLRKVEGDKHILVSPEKSLCLSENQNQM